MKEKDKSNLKVMRTMRHGKLVTLATTVLLGLPKSDS